MRDSPPLQVGYAMPHVAPLLACGNAVMAERAAWVVANLAADSPEMAAQLVRNGVVPPLVALLASKVRPWPAVACLPQHRVLCGLMGC